MQTLPLDSPQAAIEMAHTYRDAGATHLVPTQNYDMPAQYQAFVAVLCGTIRPAVSAHCGDYAGVERAVGLTARHPASVA